MNRFMRNLTASLLLSVALTAHADWPMLHGNTRHDGSATAEIKAPFRLVWTRHFVGE